MGTGCVKRRCNNRDFFSSLLFLYTSSTEISTKILVESPLYEEVPSYRQIHITLPISFHNLIQSSWILTQLIITNTTHLIQ